ncbi:MAG: hypothetical protein L6416_10145 [Candidatus Omnitrophica bacterium]|nr:hypothetical protein [Candidatus Omnitrophota bacterium]
MKKGKDKKFLEWFFEEEKSEGLEEIDEETIEINFFQAVLIIIVTVFFLLWIFRSYLKPYFRVPVFSPQEYIESKIKKNYFENNSSIKNGDFSQGLMHWVSSDGGKLFPESKSIITLCKKDYHSPPYSMKIESKNPANRMHYTKSNKEHIINNAYDYRETDHWLGVIPGSHVRVSLWYKGDVPRVSVIGLSHEGKWTGLISGGGPQTDEWKRVEVFADVPESIRAIALEITLNQGEGMPLPVIWIDDVNIEVQ